jgi:Lsr2
MERTETHLIDDLTGMRLIQSKRVSMLLGVDGKEDEFALDFDPDTLAAFMAAIRDHEWGPIRRLFTGEPTKEVKPAKPKPKPADNEPSPKEVREWARANDIEVPAKGRVPQKIMDQFTAAHP